ncbi:MAG TPA: 4Fe-4S binding protein [Usitatibacter sp.]|nr:4Fe-4S binding protein [Usitatibacter sp.]
MTLGTEMSTPAHGAGPETGSGIPQARHGLEARGWSAESVDCTPKLAALASLTRVAPPDPVASVSYHSRGNLLIVAGDDLARARRCAEALCPSLHVTLLAPDAGAPDGAPFALWSGRIETVTGYLGEFDAAIAGLARSGAAPAAGVTPARFDLLLDFSREPLFAMHQPPQGYFRAPAEASALEGTLAELREAVGEFEKPRYFALRESLCAHSRSQVEGCSACIDICSTQAISPDGDHVKVDPHLCMGCGACATVCPSGAMSYQFPRVAERGAQVKQLLAAYREAGGSDACIVFHDGGAGRALLAASAAAGRGLPPRALPLEAWHVAAVGLDLMLPAIAYGASQVVVLCAGTGDREYLEALRAQMEIGEAILAGLGRAGRHFALLEARDADALAAALEALEPAPAAVAPAAFALSNDKRTSIEFAVEHLAKLAPQPVEQIALPAGAPYGEVRVDRDKCTMCMSCVGACPESALMDGVDRPLLKFVERNCVQCGLCEATCPEGAIALSPRLLLGAPAREARLLNETQPFRCIRCDKPFGTRQMVEAMLGRLSTHGMFSRPEALRRLQMCGDCRVIDMMSAKDEISVLDAGNRS